MPGASIHSVVANQEKAASASDLVAVELGKQRRHINRGADGSHESSGSFLQNRVCDAEIVKVVLIVVAEIGHADGACSASRERAPQFGIVER
jgi:hypothetical protein